MAEFTGRRLPDTVAGDLPTGAFEAGTYWKVLDTDGKPKRKIAEGKLTEECWRAMVPFPDRDGCALANLANHTVREHEDGTISVRPGDGSSNSILVRGGTEHEWHGYIEHGVFREC